LAPDAGAAMLKIEGLHAGYGALPVLRDVSLSIGTDDIVGLLGANGAGKTTLVRTVCGLLRPTSGRIEMAGVDLAAVAPHLRPGRGLAVVLEGRNLFGEMTVRENLRLAERTGAGREMRGQRFTLAEVLELFPVLAEKIDVTVRLLSGGQQQMVAIARALLLQPALLILDEPSTGLAPKVIKDIMQILHKLRRRGMSMLLVEQNTAMAAELTDRAYVLALGRIVHEIKPGEWQAALGSSEMVSAYLGRT
jgi:ABC-type branched-subunit amino acid transport system ATPase component